MTVPEFPDQRALARLGESVRRRLAADPSVQRVAIDAAEMYAVGGFIGEEERARLIALIDATARPSAVFDTKLYGAYRTSYSCSLDPTDSFVQMVQRRISDLLGIDESWSETVQGQRYTPGQEFRAHCDWFDPSAPYWPGEQRRGGQRSWTAMAYLNEVTEGGATVFEKLGVNVQPQAGALLAWNNALPDGRPNPDVVHAAAPVVQGVKYVVTKWFRTRRWA